MDQSLEALLAGASCLVVSCGSPGLYAGYSVAAPRLEAVHAQPSGLSLGFEADLGDSRGFTELRVLDDDEEGLRLTDVLLGARRSLVEGGWGALGISLDMGAGSARLDSLANSNTLVSFGAGVYTGLRVSRSVSIFVQGGGRYYLDATEPTTCNDGTTSSSTGSGTCSHHGGIDTYNEYIGDGFGWEFLVGLRVMLPGAEPSHP